MTVDVAICDVMVLCQLLVENAVLRGDSLVDVQRLLEIVYLEFACVQEEEL